MVQLRMKVQHVRSLGKVRWIVLLLSLAGVFISGVALVEHLIYANGLATGPSFCNINAYINCEAVNASAWSKIFGLPIGAYGIFFYLTLFALFTVAGAGRAVSFEAAAGVALIAGVLATGASIVLFGISSFIIGALCLICIALYLINFLLLGVIALGAWRGRFREGIAKGCSGVRLFLTRSLGITSSKKGATATFARCSLLALVGLSVFAVLLPNMLLQYLRIEQGTASQILDMEAVAAWRARPLEAPQVIDDGGRFADYREGNPQAPISIVEFADYECFGCRRLYVALHELLTSYAGSYTFVLKNYPLDRECNPVMPRTVHLHACTAAYFSRCAGEQGKLGAAIDLLFTDPLLEQDGEIAEVREALIAKGESELELDGESLRGCIVSKRYHTKIQGDVSEGQRLGLASTPSIWVNGRLVVRPTIGALKAIFDAILSEKR